MQDLSYSRRDSERFGLVIFRAREEGIDSSELMKQILDHNVDTAIIRIKTELLSQIHKLEKTAMPIRITDTLAYYHQDLSTYKKQALINRNLTFEEATTKDFEDLNLLVRETFGNYVNHYRMNPFMDNELVTQGYQDWVTSYASGHPERKCWIAREDGMAVAFATFNLETGEKIKAILCGVKTTHRERGIFHDMLTVARNFAKEQGKTYMRAICQIENIAVQRILTHQGFELHHTENTIHINAMLTKSVFEPFTESVHFSVDDIKEKTLNQNILMEINKQFDDKQNITTQNHRFVNIQRMTKEASYKMHFSFPMGNKGLLRVMDDDNNTYVLVYFDLKHFFA
ncbi:GNAT family N-acetyltransferase [Limibacter armeniacum]|uniref:GNAT family N-acetyltransferase n=1 Tax=Limibacter armeniacum TaxID=466084 RepID=UPI002FE50A23